VICAKNHKREAGSKRDTRPRIRAGEGKVLDDGPFPDLVPRSPNGPGGSLQGTHRAMAATKEETMHRGERRNPRENNEVQAFLGKIPRT